MLFIQHFAKDRPKPGCTAAITNCSLQMNETAKFEGFSGAVVPGAFSPPNIRSQQPPPSSSSKPTTQRQAPRPPCALPRRVVVSVLIVKKEKGKKKIKRGKIKGIYEELRLFGCHLPLIFRLICFWGLWVSLRWRICSKSIWWFCQDLYLKPYPLNYTAVTWQKDDWINEGLLQYSWFEKLENNTSLCPRESWLFH